MKNLMERLLAITLLLLAACASNSKTPQTPERLILAPKLTPIDVLVPTTVTAIPTQIIISTPTFVPTPTPIPPLSWANENEIVTTFEKSHAQWSPVANEILLYDCYQIIQQSDSIIIAKAPDFSANALTLNYDCPYSPEMIWTPDGQKIIFGSPPPADDPDAEYFRYLDIWILDSKGKDARPISQGQTRSRGLAFLGWIDNQTLVYKDHSGTVIMISMLDIKSGKHVSTLVMDSRGHSLISPNSIYIAGSYCSGECYALATSKTDISSVDRWKVIDKQKTKFLKFPKYVETLAKEFMPGTNKMLMLNFGKVYSPANFVSQLTLWDLDQNTLTSIAPGGVDGHFSADGRWLAYLTVGPAQLDKQDQTITSSLPINIQPYLQLLDVRNGQMAFSVPTLVQADEYELQRYGHFYNLLIAFSPDNQYLTFLTPYQIQIDERDKTIKVIKTRDTSTYLHLYNINSKQIVYSMKSNPMAPIWSPRSDRFVYRNEQGNLAIFDISSGLTNLLTQTGGIRIKPQWSFNGQYLSLSQAFFVHGQEPPQTVIIKVP